MFVGLSVVFLGVVVAIAAQGREWSSGAGGAGWSTRFLAFGLVAGIGLVWLAVVVWFARLIRSPMPVGLELRLNKRLLVIVVLLATLAAVAFLYLLFAHNNLPTFGGHVLVGHFGGAQGPGQVTPNKGRSSSADHAGVPPVWIWLPGGVVAVLLAAGAVVFVRRRAAAVVAASDEQVSARAVSLLVGESLDDLRRERDARRAVIACYARMERVLSRLALRREPSEAPFEYLERVLVQLRASSSSVRRLTHLFEEAKFSEHVVNERMRTEAIGALSSLQRELEVAP
jgi:hypothetical protein